MPVICYDHLQNVCVCNFCMSVCAGDEDAISLSSPLDRLSASNAVHVRIRHAVQMSRALSKSGWHVT